MNRFKQVFWGIFFLIAAVLVVLSGFGYLAGISVFTVVATAVLTSILIGSIPSGNFFGIFMPIGLLLVVYKDALLGFGMPPISNWVFVFAALLVSIAFSIFFRRSSFKMDRHFRTNFVPPIVTGQDVFNARTNSQDSNNIKEGVTFGNSVKYINASAFESARLECSFGNLQVYFDQTTPAETGAHIHVDCSFGDITLFVPDNWEIISTVTGAFGAVDDRPNSFRNTIKTHTVHISGSASFGKVSVQYIAI